MGEVTNRNNRLFLNSYVICLPSIPIFIGYLKKYDKLVMLKDSEHNEVLKILMYDMLLMCRKFVYDTENGLTPEDIYNLLVSNNMADIDVKELNDLMNTVLLSIKELTTYLVSYDILNSNYYVLELTEDTIILEVERTDI